MSTRPVVTEVRRDKVSREVRLELADWRTRTGGVYDLPHADQESLLIEGHLPGMGLFLPDFVIVLATGDPLGDDRARWTDLRVHVGGCQWPDPALDPVARRVANRAAARDWHSVDDLLNGTYRMPGAPPWLLDLIEAQTPWADLLAAQGDS